MFMLKEKTLKEVRALIERHPELGPLQPQIVDAIQALTDTVHADGKILICGNGGSAADSLHIVGELMKSFALPRTIDPERQEKIRSLFSDDAEYYIKNLQGGVSAISLLNEVSLTSAYGNDCQPDLVFAQQVLGYGKEGDLLVAISTSGNSKNVVHAAKIAKVMGMKTIALTGTDGGKLRALSDILIAVPAKETYIVQELHMPVYHALCLALEIEIFD